MDCRKTIKRLDCGNDLNNQATPEYKPFSVCLPFGRSLHWDGQGMRLEENVTLPDGKYGVITVQNGCITNAEEQPVCEYTPQPCTPAATGCSDTSGSGITLQPGADNLLNWDASGRLGASLNVQGEGGVTVTGYGTSTDPLVISYSASAAARTYVKNGDNAIGVSGTGTQTDPYYITHKESGLEAGTYNGITVDAYGHVTAVEEITNAITGLVATTGVELKQMGTIYTIGLPVYSSLEEGYTFGGYNISLTANGVISAVSQIISIDTGDEQTVTIDPRFAYITLNKYGSVAGYTSHTLNADDKFVEVFDPSRNSTAFNFTTTKQAYFKVTYRGALTVTSSSSSSSTTTHGLFSLPRPYTIKVDGKNIPAYARYEAGTSSSSSRYIDLVIGVSDAFYAAGAHSVQLYANTDDFSFDDIGILTVELVAKSDSD